MNKKSILLAINGSQQSLDAAEVAWSLAKATGSQVTAQSVVDSQSIWELVGQDLPGIIGSGPYLAAHETVYRAFRSIAEALLAAYESRAQAQNITTECVLDEGNMIREVLKRANSHDFVVVGHRSEFKHRHEEEQISLIRAGLSELLAHYCAVPILIVQHKFKPWTKARLVVSSKTFGAKELGTFFDFVEPLKITREVYCIGPEGSVDELVDKVQKSTAKSQPVKVMKPNLDDGDEPFDCALDVPLDTLLVVTTQQVDGERRTCAGTDLDTFIGNVTTQSVLVLPPGIKDNTEQQPSVMAHHA